MRKQKFTVFDNLTKGALALACALPVTVSAATVDLLGATFGSGTTKNFTGLFGSVDASFAANGGAFQTKTVAGYTGVGVGGKTGGEIDIGESIVGTFSSAVYVPYLTLAFLFDGPEFGDVQEKASVSATLAGGGTLSYTLTAIFQGAYEWTGGSNTVEKLSIPTRNAAGVWEIEDPFDGMSITGLTLTALTGACGRGSCTNQSDFALHGLGVEEVQSSTNTEIIPTPEPGTVGLLLAGLGLLGAAALRRR